MTWIAWNDDHTKIIAKGEDMEKVEKQATELVGEEYWLDFSPNGYMA